MRSRKRLVASIAALMAGGMIAFAAPAAYALGNTPDPTCFDVRGKVFALTETSDNATIYVGGKFSRASLMDGSKAYAASSLTRFNTATCGGDKNFVPTVTDATGVEPGIINGMALNGSTLYIVGNFDLVNGQPRKDIAAINTSDGSVLPFTATPANQLNTILLQTNGEGTVTRIIVGGAFNRVNNKPRSNLAALLPDGTVDTSFSAQTDGTVRDLEWASDGQTLFVAGNYINVAANGVNYPRQSLARINLDGSVNPWAVPLGVIPNPMNAWKMVPTATTLYVGLGAGPNFTAAYALDQGDMGTQVMKHNMTGNVESVALAADGQHLFLSGHFGTSRKGTSMPGCPTGMEAHGLAELDLTTSKLVCWAPHMLPDTGNFIGGWTLLLDPTYLWVGGSFTQICQPDGVTGCVNSQSIARFTL
jgi:hypothetical protein